MKPACHFTSLLFLWFAAISLLAPRETEARVIYVGASETYNSIKYALSQARANDTIIVRDGVYVEDIKVRLPVLLMAENRHQAVIGDGSATKANIYIGQNEVNGAIIDGFRFAPGAWHGIRIGDGNGDFFVVNTEVRNCLIEGRMKGIFVTPRVHNVRITDNVIRGCSQEGISYSGNGQTIISGNTIEDGETPGIFISEMGDGSPHIADNTITGNQGGGILLERAGIILERNLIAGNRFGVGTNTACDGLVIRDSNQIVDNLEHGIQIESHIQVTVKESVVRGNGGSGIHSNGDILVQRNAISQNGEMGIWTQTGSAHIEDNDIELNTFHGVEIGMEMDDVNVFGNRISGNQIHGLMLQDEATVRGNVFRENQERGMSITGDAKNVLVSGGNIFAGNKYCQIQVDRNCEAYFLNNSIYGDSTKLLGDEGPGGVIIEGSARVEGNSIGHIHGPAIEIAEGAGEIEVRAGNSVEYSFEGIISRVPTNIMGNQISFCANRGIWLQGSQSGSTIGWNKVSGCSDGIRCEETVSGMEIKWNTVSGNINGIVTGGAVVLRSNTITKNAGTGLFVNGEGTNLGSLYPVDSGKNAIFDNGWCNLHNNSQDTLWAPFNFWDSGEPDIIDASIRDNEEEGTGPVIFEPWLGDFNVGKKDDPISEAGSGPSFSAWPNPFRDEVTLRFPVHPDRNTEIRILDMNGRLIHSSGQLNLQTAGFSSYVWKGAGPDMHPLPPGLYLAIFIQGGKAMDAPFLILIRK